MTLTIISTRDRNKARAHPLHHREKRRTPPERIDQITTLAGDDGVTVEVRRVRVIQLGIDGHDALAVDMVLRKGNQSVKITVVTANIGRGVPQQVARRNIRTVLRRFRWVWGRWWTRYVFIGFQEIDDDDKAEEYRILVANMLKGDRLVGAPSACPSVCPKGWRIVHDNVIQTSPGRAGATPHRVCTVAVYEHLRTGIRFRHPNGQWPRDEIRDLWAVCEASWQGLYAGWVR